MMIPAPKVFFCLSLFAFLGTHARTLPEDTFMNHYDIIIRTKAPPPPPHVAPPHIPTNAYHKWNSVFAIYGRTAADPSNPSPQVGELMSSNYVTTAGLIHEEIIKRPTSLAPPPPHVAPPHIQASAKFMQPKCCSYIKPLREDARGF